MSVPGPNIRSLLGAAASSPESCSQVVLHTNGQFTDGLYVGEYSFGHRNDGQVSSLTSGCYNCFHSKLVCDVLGF